MEFKVYDNNQTIRYWPEVSEMSSPSSGNDSFEYHVDDWQQNLLAIENFLGA